ncbi:NAC domain-containing protein 7-like protein, partial [Tanacetum coccineum]
MKGHPDGMTWLSKKRDNEMMMSFTTRDIINLRKKMLNLEEAKGPELRNRPQWKEATKSEIDSILDNHTWKLVDLPPDLEEKIYIEQTEGFTALGQEGKVCKLVKSLYRLKQAPKQWHRKFDHVMLEYDMLIVGSNDKMIQSTKDMLKSRFDMKDMGLANVVLGVKITRTQNGLLLSQTHFVDKILEKYNPNDSNIVRTPTDTTKHLSKNRGQGVNQTGYSSIIGILMYLMNCTRPDLAYADHHDYNEHDYEELTVSGR